MKIIHLMSYLYHTIMRRLFRRKGKYQTASFEYHHHKRKHYKSLLALIVVLLLFNQPVTAEFKSDEDKSIETARKLLKSTVKIESGTDNGSGFFIAPNVVLTNTHVILKAPKSEVRLIKKDGTTCRGTIGYREEIIDLAIITSDCTGTPIAIATEAAEGQTVIVSGNPSGYDFTITKGVISAFRSEWLQFDAKVNYGSSGGVMANLNGEVVGVVTRKEFTYEYMGFAVPYNRLAQFLDRSGYDELLATY